jgi:ribonuclease HII
MRLGIDEAGRGPVIGPMVIAGVLIDDDQERRLKELGIKDSKLISPLKREELFEHIIKISANTKIVEISPKDIDKTLNKEGTNLNFLEADVSSSIITELKPDQAILDCPSNNPLKFKEYVNSTLIKKLDYKVDLVVEHKADLNHISVGAASILAKVTRDRKVREIEKKIGIRIGSGYPSDPITISFLKHNYKKYPEIFRKTWASYKKLISTNKQTSLGSF